MDPTHICLHNHAHRPGDILAEAERHCALSGLRLTEQRRSVLALLAGSPTPLGAYDLLERSRTDAADGMRPKRLAPIAIYRALDFLLEAGLIHRLESRNAFFVCPHRHEDDASIVFMVCESCGQVEEAASRAIADGLEALAAERGFSKRAQVIELSGRCSACARAEAETELDTGAKAGNGSFSKHLMREPS